MAAKSATKVTGSTKRRTIDDLIADRKPRLPEFTSEQREQVAEALEHNERTVAMKHRLSLATVHGLLREDYGFTPSLPQLEQMVKAVFGRRSWTAK